MKTSVIISSLLSVAANNPAGYTVGLDMQPIVHGYAVAVAETQNSFGEAGLRRVVDFVADHAPAVSAFGGWYNSEDGQFYFDATIICETREEAERIARANKQLAYFHLDTCTEIRVNY